MENTIFCKFDSVLSIWSAYHALPIRSLPNFHFHRHITWCHLLDVHKGYLVKIFVSYASMEASFKLHFSTCFSISFWLAAFWNLKYSNVLIATISREVNLENVLLQNPKYIKKQKQANKTKHNITEARGKMHCLS